jgi:hypothetical protein
MVFCQPDAQSVATASDGSLVLYLDQIENSGALPEGVLEALKGL